ncbi:hypothetical protein [Capnocytophaga canis]|uniref:hypothetical protein n=1 Tax=Capnocytophaga canis TaxID=1848903 RepID=UPI00156296EF|nr:hypothetical protein [Capnocytophaga canis]
MRKIYVSLLVLFFISCSKNENKEIYGSEKKIDDKTLADHFGFDSLESNAFVDVANINIDASVDELQKVGLKVFNEGKTIYAVPYKDDSKKFLITDGNVQFTLDINVDAEGSGEVIEEFPSGEIFVKEFDNGKIIDPNDSLSYLKRPKSKFRKCFDDGYDDICDDFLGCVAWYAYPPIPIMTAIYCEFFKK